jgi:hypothetical protein
VTKAEYIERYGIEGYELHKARTKEDSKNLYNDPIRRELQKEVESGIKNIIYLDKRNINAYESINMLKTVILI